MDKNNLAQALFGAERDEEPSRKSEPAIIYGKAVSDSSNGMVEIEVDGHVTVPSGSGSTITVPTTPRVAAGDDVMVIASGGVGKTGMAVFSNPGSGDSTDAIARRAETDAARAAAAATSAETSAQSAAQSASTAASAAQQAVADAGTASTAAQQAATSAGNAQTSASQAATSAGQAASSASTASTAAQQAATKATEATTAANSALVQLGTVEDVIGTVNWIAEHGHYDLTSDTQVDPDKVYYTRTGSGTSQDPYVYTEVAEPTQEGLSGYYELTVNEAVSQFVNAHLSLTSAGLYILKDSSGYKVLLSNTGMTVYDPQGTAVATYGQSITFAQDRPFTIGDSDAYIAFDGNGHISISGSGVTISALSDYATKFEAEQNAAAINNAMSAIEQAQTTTTAQLTALSDSVNVSINSLTQTVGEQADVISDVNKVFEFTANGLVIGQSDSPVKSVLDNSSMRFQANGQDVLVLDGETSTAEMDRMKMGKYRWQSVDDGEAIALVYVG